MTKCISCIHSGVCKYKEAIENFDKNLSEILENDTKTIDVKDIIYIETGCKNYSSFTITAPFSGREYIPTVANTEAIPMSLGNTVAECACNKPNDRLGLAVIDSKDLSENKMLFARRNVNV